MAATISDTTPRAPSDATDLQRSDARHELAEDGTPIRVLVVDDEGSILDIVRGFLEAVDGPSAVEAARESRPEVVVLDVMLPGFDGLEALRQIRSFADPYVLLLTARNEEVDRIVGLTVGADDYLQTPFSRGELVARVRALLRRRREPETDGGQVMRSGDLSVDVPGRAVTVAGESVELTAIEFDLLDRK